MRGMTEVSNITVLHIPSLASVKNSLESTESIKGEDVSTYHVTVNRSIGAIHITRSGRAWARFI